MSSSINERRWRFFSPVRRAHSYAPGDESEANAEARNEEINRILRKEKVLWKTTSRVLMMGPEGSGKTTISQQISLFSPYHEKLLRVKENIRDAILAMCNNLKTLNPPVLQQCIQYQHYVYFIISEAGRFDSGDFSECYDRVEILWNDVRIRNFCKKQSRCDFNHVKYFLDKVPLIRKADYTPSKQDLKMCKPSDVPWRETKFQIGKANLILLDSHRPDIRWRCFQIFAEVIAVVFVVDISAYNLDKDANGSLEGALDMFQRLLYNRWLRESFFILFLNKFDLFKRKILERQHRLEDYYPEFLNYQPKSDVYDQTEDPLVTRAKNFILDKFMNETKKMHYVYFRREGFCFPHFTCGLDAEKLYLRLYDDCKDVLIRIQEKQYELL